MKFLNISLAALLLAVLPQIANAKSIFVCTANCGGVLNSNGANTNPASVLTYSQVAMGNSEKEAKAKLFQKCPNPMIGYDIASGENTFTVISNTYAFPMIHPVSCDSMDL